MAKNSGYQIPPMNCRDNESLILAERDGGLTKAQLASLSDHVTACPACARLRANLAAALDAYQAGVDAIPVPDTDEVWRDLQTRLHGAEGKSSRRRPLAPIIWFGASLAIAAALALAFFVTRPAPSTPATELANTPPPYDPSVIAGADFVEAGNPDASTMVYVDKESGWLVVWAAELDTTSSG
jgi:anti-sigma factor RsiW